MAGGDPLEFDERLRLARSGPLNPLQLDRQVAAAARVYRGWQRELPRDAHAADDPLAGFRSVSTRRAFGDLSQLGEDDPLRQYLARWTVCLGERRINARQLQRVQALRHHERVPVEDADPPGMSLAELLHSALARPRAADLWLPRYVAHCQPYAQQLSLLWERRAELVRRWDVGSWDAATGCGVDAVQVARDWLARTHDAFTALPPRRFSDVIEMGLAREAALDWPVHLSFRSLRELFAGSPMLTVLTSAPPTLPARLAPASFMRALMALGEQWAWAQAPADQFFTVAHEPFRLHEHVHGALFGLLPLSQSFLCKQLHAASARALEARRAFSRSVLLETRVRAFKVLLVDAALRGRAALEETFANEGPHHLRSELPPRAAGALLVPHTEQAQQLVGPLLAALRFRQLTEAHDEDWFRNPRGVEQLHGEASLPPRAHTDQERCEAGATLLYQQIASALG